MRKQPATSVGEIVFISAVVGLLVSVLSPMVAGRRLTGDAATCLSNERRIGVALRVYADDYDACFPMNRLNSLGREWKDELAPYIASDTTQVKTVLTCTGNFAASAVDESGRWPRSYAYNAALEWGKFQSSYNTSQPFRFTDTRAPGRYMLILESRNIQPDLGPWMINGNASPDAAWSNPVVRYWNENPASGLGVFHHHDKYMNVVMVDGRATSATLPQTIAVPQMWNPWQAPDAYTGKLAGMLDEYK